MYLWMIDSHRKCVRNLNRNFVRCVWRAVFFKTADLMENSMVEFQIVFSETNQWPFVICLSIVYWTAFNLDQLDLDKFVGHECPAYIRTGLIYILEIYNLVLSERWLRELDFSSRKRCPQTIKWYIVNICRY